MPCSVEIRNYVKKTETILDTDGKVRRVRLRYKNYTVKEQRYKAVRSTHCTTNRLASACDDTR